MDNTKEELVVNKDNSKIFKITNIVLFVIEILSSLAFIPLQIIKFVHDRPAYPDGHGGWLYNDYYYNLWDNIDDHYMILFNILLFVSILFNIICIIKINKINKKFFIIAHIIFAAVIMVLIPILFFGTQSRDY